MKRSGLAVLGLALTAATAASAQTTVMRQVSDMPVETTITRAPDGSTMITRRVLPVDGETIVEAPAMRMMTRSVRTEVPRRASSRVVRTETRVVNRRAAAPVYAMATAGPVALSAADRGLVYREIVQTRAVVAPGPTGILAPFSPLLPPAPPMVVETTTPAVTYTRPMYTQPMYAQPMRTTYVVGSRLPTDVRLIELPEAVVARVPSIAPYAYASVDGRLLLVDPQTGIIVADITN